ncbi:MFS transporter [Arcticibacter sp.]|uniref:MFS transporter n=1 Tax=Arcticibacter sp. TaxID=1872630 RepID=UPI00389104D9
MAQLPATTKSLKDSNQRISTILAFALIPLSGFATDIYLPSLPSMSTVLDVSSTKIQLTLSLFLITYGISQLFIGSIVDSFGRYKISLICLLIFAISCIVISTTDNIYIIYLMRIIHGFTVAAVIVAKRAFFVDVYEGEKLKHYLSLFSIIWSTGPIIAPFVGGYLQNAFGWESNFYFLAGMASVLVVLEFIYSGETLKNFSDFSVSKMVAVYGDMLKTPSFSLGLIMLGLAYCMVMVFNMTGPFIIEHHFNGTPIIAGYSSLILGFAWMTGGFIGKATINRPFVKKMVVNIGLQLLFVSTMLISIPVVSNLYSMIFFAFIIHVTAGYIFNNYFTYCLGRFPNNAGVASGLTGGITYVIVSFLSYGVVTLLPAKDELNLGYSYLLVTVLSVFIMWMVYKTSGRKVKA